VDDYTGFDRLSSGVYVAARAGTVDCTDAFDLATAWLGEHPQDPDATELATLSIECSAANQPRMAEVALRLLATASFYPGFKEEPGWLACLEDAMRVVNRDVAATGIARPCQLRVHDDDGFNWSVNAYVKTWDGYTGTAQGIYPASGADLVSAVVYVAEDAQDALMHAIFAAWPVCPVHRLGVHATEHEEAAVWWCSGDGGHSVTAIGAWQDRLSATLGCPSFEIQHGDCYPGIPAADHRRPRQHTSLLPVYARLMVALKAGQADDSPVCRYCRHPAALESNCCPLCGAPLDIRFTASGWMEQPMIQSMTRIRCGKTRCQIAGTLTPAAEFDLAPDDWIYFAPHALLWADAALTLTLAPVPRSYDPAARPGHDPRPADLPRRLLEAHGPGRIGVSENHAGELIAVPLSAGQSVHTLQNQLLCATGAVSYRYLRSPIHYRKYSRRGEHEYEYPSGRYHYQFTASRRPGLLLLHAAGNVFLRDLAENESILVESGAPVYWEDSILISMHLEYVRTPVVKNRRDPGTYRKIWLRLTGPGRVAVQSIHKPAEETGTPDYLSFRTVKRW
jgi:hypothetical protein